MKIPVGRTLKATKILLIFTIILIEVLGVVFLKQNSVPILRTFISSPFLPKQNPITTKWYSNVSIPPPTIHLNILQSPNLFLLLENKFQFVFMCFPFCCCKHCYLCLISLSSFPSWNIPIKAQCKHNESVYDEMVLVIQPQHLLMEKSPPQKWGGSKLPFLDSSAA